VSANGLRRKTQLSRNQSLISHLVSVRRRWNYRFFAEHLCPDLFFLFPQAMIFFLQRVAPRRFGAFVSGRFCSPTKLQFALPKLRGASPVRYCTVTRMCSTTYVRTTIIRRYRELYAEIAFRDKMPRKYAFNCNIV